MSEVVVNTNPDTPNLRRLVRFAAHWGDAALDADFDCFRDSCTEVEWKAFRRYVRSRRTAPGWRPRDYHSSNHNRIIGEPWLDRIEEDPDSTTCANCGVEFTAKRSTSRFCSPRCRVAASRAGSRSSVLR